MSSTKPAVVMRSMSGEACPHLAGGAPLGVAKGLLVGGGLALDDGHHLRLLLQVLRHLGLQEHRNKKTAEGLSARHSIMRAQMPSPLRPASVQLILEQPQRHQHCASSTIKQDGPVREGLPETSFLGADGAHGTLLPEPCGELPQATARG